MKCLVSDCANEAKQKTLCYKHHGRLHRNGSFDLHPKYQKIEFKRQLFREGKSLCSKCQEIKSLDQFSKSKNRFGGINCYCRLCKASQVDENSHRGRALKRFGITLEEYNQILDRQNHTCAICKKPETAVKRRHNNSKPRPLSVDHDHVTGRVRGLLCGGCNTALGLLKEDIFLFEECIKYLKEIGEYDVR